MNAPVQPPSAAIRVELNYAADRSENGVWSNLTPEIRTQRLIACPVEIRDARRLAAPPTLAEQGFAIIDAPLAEPDWDDPAWIDDTYLPGCLDLVQAATGARHVALFHPGVLFRSAGRREGAPPADFVHFDNTREAALEFLDRAVPQEIREAHPRVQIYNVWRSITPPPQDVPLALCDQRSLHEADWVIGRTVEPNFPAGVPYVASVPNPDHRWYYFSDVALDEAIVFKGWDSDPAAPFGCLHGAFRSGAVASEPRTSVEMRVFALFEA